MRLIHMGCEQRDISFHQQALLEHAEPKSIAHGAVVPFEVMKQFVREGMLLEFGSGTGEKGHVPSQYGYTGIDINRDAVDIALHTITLCLFLETFELFGAMT